MSGLSDIRRREEIDLADRAAEIREELLPELDDRIAAAEEAADPEHAPEELRGLRTRLETQAEQADRVIEALAGGSFVIRELLTAETARLQDDVAAEQFDIDFEREEVDGSMKDGYHKVRTLELAVEEAPEAMESYRDPEFGEVYQVGLLPDLIADYLFECVTSLNDAGEVDGVGNLSHYGVQSAGD